MRVQGIIAPYADRKIFQIDAEMPLAPDQGKPPGPFYGSLCWPQMVFVHI